MKVRSDVTQLQNLIRKLAEKQGIPLTRLAFEAQVSYQGLRHFLAGRASIRVDMFDRILKVLGLDLNIALQFHEQENIVIHALERQLTGAIEH